MKVKEKMNSMVDNILTYTILGSFKSCWVKSLSIPEYCPTPYYYLSRRCHQCYHLRFITTQQSMIENSQRVVSPDASQGSHKKIVTYTTITLTRNTAPFMNTNPTLVWFGIQTKISCYPPWMFLWIQSTD